MTRTRQRSTSREDALGAWNEVPVENFLSEDPVLSEIERNMQESWPNNPEQFSRQLAFFADRNRQRRDALMQSLRAYTPPRPFPNPALVEELKPPIPVAITKEHEAVCQAVDACDEYRGDLNVAPEPSFFCPVTYFALRDPVSAADGYVYEKTVIETSKKAANVRMVQWTSPMTRMQWCELSGFPQSSATVTSMRLWVIMKAVEVAGAKWTDSVILCAEKLKSLVTGESGSDVVESEPKWNSFENSS